MIAVLGAGSWGTALAILIAQNGFRTLLWGRDAARQAQLAHERENTRYLPGVRFPEDLLIREDLLATVEAAGHVLLAAPSHAFRATLEAIRDRLAPDAVVAWASKGLEPATGRLLSQVAADVLGEKRAIGLVSGPTFAKEVAQGLPTAVAVAARDPASAETIATWLRSERVRVYIGCDLVGKRGSQLLLGNDLVLGEQVTDTDFLGFYGRYRHADIPLAGSVRAASFGLLSSECR